MATTTSLLYRIAASTNSLLFATSCQSLKRLKYSNVTHWVHHQVGLGYWYVRSRSVQAKRLIYLSNLCLHTAISSSSVIASGCFKHTLDHAFVCQLCHKSLFNPFLKNWVQFRKIDSQEHFESAEGDQIVRVDIVVLKTVHGVFMVQSLGLVQPWKVWILYQRETSSLTSTIAAWNERCSSDESSSSLMCRSEDTRTWYSASAGIAKGLPLACPHLRINKWRERLAMHQALTIEYALTMISEAAVIKR